MLKFCLNIVFFQIKDIRKIMKKFFLFIIIILFIYIKPAFSKNVKVFEFTYNELKNLKIRKVSGAKNKTIYTLGSDERAITTRL